MDIAEEFACAKDVFVIAAAGCGKTNLIARSVSQYNTGRELILTHTNAGVYAISERLSRMGTPRKIYSVATIAGWALKFASAYPSLSALLSTRPSTQQEWEDVYNAASRLLENRVIRDVIVNSYSGLYVDEYQDCLLLQHGLISQLAQLLPCRIVGDPLQGIFGFGSNVIVDWDKDVAPRFNFLCELDHPWRWQGNLELGNWLIGIRKQLLAHEDIDLGKAPAQVTWRKADPLDQIKTCHQICGTGNGSVCILRPVEKQCFDLARKLGGRYVGTETVECKPLFEWADKLESTNGDDRAIAVTEFAIECCTGVSTILKNMKSLLSSSSHIRSAVLLDMRRLLIAISSEKSLAPIIIALEAIKSLKGVKLVRKELYYDMISSLREYMEGDYQHLSDAAWRVRERTRSIGRSIGKRVVSRTLLIKGLEFDHCIVFEADSHNARNLYVALTRGTHSLTVFSKSNLLKPK